MGNQTTMAYAHVPVLVIHPARPPKPLRWQGKSVSTTFGLVLLGSLIVLGLAGAPMGHWIQQALMSAQEKAALYTQVEKLEYQDQALTE